MKIKLLRLLVLIVAIIPGIIVCCQKVVPYTGDIYILKNEKTLNVQFSYDKMKVGKLDSEQKYTDKRVNEYDTKEQGKGTEWLAEWNENKKFWEKSFIERFNNDLSKKGVKMGLNQNDAKYILLINPLFLEIGWNALLISQCAEIDLEILVFQADDIENQKARILIENGFGVNETEKERIAGAYKSAARNLVKFLSRNVY